MYMEMKFLAHITDIDGERKEQGLKEHLLNTAELSSMFAKEFNNEKFAYLCGLAHDLGKYSDAFQKRIRGNPKKCDHSTAGAREVFKSIPYGKFLSYCIAGHHSGLQNVGTKFDVGSEGTLYGRLSSENSIEDYEAYKNEIEEKLTLVDHPKIRPLDKAGFSFSFFIRMLYSCLVDADFLDTEKFMSNGKVERIVNYDFNSMVDNFNKEVSKFKGSKGIINEKRTEIFNSCVEKSKMKRGLFTLTVPTGGGKTLSSMAFAINHLIKNDMKRIIYVIPYTSIIEQNAKVFSNIFGNNLILEHHSNYDFKDDENENYNIKKLSSENWDMPIIVTTNVQFFESLFANKSSKCRKLHNITNSIIIFDEAQMLPTEYLKPCIKAISELVYNYKCTAVLCSATQPSITKMFPKEIESIEICEDTYKLYEIFNRTKIIQRGKIEDLDLVNEINELQQCLVIVNTRKHALKLFPLIKGQGVFHLSTLMCPAHRKKTISEIRRRLSNGESCKVISTRLIEAGVDVDFPIVYRVNAGLDSIVQSAGRCNREGKLKDKDGNLILGEVHVFEPEQEFIKSQPNAFKRPIEVTDIIKRKYEDITSPQAIENYFEQLYSYNGEKGLDIKEIVKSLESGMSPNSRNLDAQINFNFVDVAKDFKLIEDNTHSVIIPFDEKAKDLIEQLRHSKYIGEILRSLQGYTVNIYSNEYNSLFGAGKLDFVKSDIPILRSIDDYDMDTGIKIDIQMGIGVFF